MLCRLRKAGFESYLVGGGVRDLLLGRTPKDFDVATDARPEEVRKLFRNCRLIGRRFRLAHIHFGREIIEVATFRAHHDQGDDEGMGIMENGMIVRDNVYGNIEDDANRRDFTVNALYYNIHDSSVVDYTGGMKDLQQGVLQIIGDPINRFQEDPVRMLRIVRFAAKLTFHIPHDLEQHILSLGDKIRAVSPARLLDEVIKLFLYGHALRTYELLHRYQLFGYLFPLTQKHLLQNERLTDPLIRLAFHNTDKRIAEDKPVTLAFILATLLWAPVRTEAKHLQENGMAAIQSLHVAGNTVIKNQLQHVSVPRRSQNSIREIWTNQIRLTRLAGKRPLHLLEQRWFRMSYDFMLLRGEVGEVDQALCDWWTEFQLKDKTGRMTMNRDTKEKTHKSRRRRKRRNAVILPKIEP